MKTVNSLSGGKTSSYLAINYPADMEVFALVCFDNHNAGKATESEEYSKGMKIERNCLQ